MDIEAFEIVDSLKISTLLRTGFLTVMFFNNSGCSKVKGGFRISFKANVTFPSVKVT